MKLTVLQRYIEQEHKDLFPNDPPFICSKISDSNGYNLQLNSQVSDMLSNNE